ncbi:MAG: PadR family transcriptional regulator [Pseudomonadales bacterium]
MARQTTDLLQGTLDLLILKVLSSAPEHGWGIAQQIQVASRDLLSVNQGSLYPALRRLEARGMIRARWGTSVNNRRARFYQLTKEGEGRLDIELSSWQRFAGAVNLILAT